jgi:arginase family enzyme
MPDLENAHLVILGCPEERGQYILPAQHSAPDSIRQEFYGLYNWHHDIRIADIGNIKKGRSLNDTHACLRMVLRELYQLGKTVIILGGSHDLTLAQYYSYVDEERMIEGICVDAKIDLDMESHRKSDHFLMEMLTGEPNFLRHYSHVGFQSYFVHPHMLETMDKLRFDCIRVGHARENIEEMEPVIRHADLFSFDISAIAHAYAPANQVTTNGLNGEEACLLTRYAGLSPVVSTIGIYGYNPSQDRMDLTAKQIAQMIWYFIDGRYKGLKESGLEERHNFNEYHIAFGEVETVFLQSKKTGRWWMQLPDQKYIACSYNDYLTASSNEIPERWLRAQERSF